MVLFHVGADLPRTTWTVARATLWAVRVVIVGDVVGGVDRRSGDGVCGVGGEMRGGMGGVMHVPGGGVDEFVAKGGLGVRLGPGGKQSGEAERASEQSAETVPRRG